jgi:hypothetical protein
LATAGYALLAVTMAGAALAHIFALGHGFLPDHPWRALSFSRRLLREPVECMKDAIDAATRPLAGPIALGMPCVGIAASVSYRGTMISHRVCLWVHPKPQGVSS